MEPPVVAAPPPTAEPGRLGRYATGAFFLAPALIVLLVWIVYPAVYTIVRSFFGQQGYVGTWVGIDNYKTLFTSDLLLTAIKNNAIWVAVVPAFVTAVGLMFAVLTERVSWSVAFKTAVFMPMAISAFAAGVIWRIMDQQDPNLGAVNAVIASVKDTISPPGVLSDAKPGELGRTVMMGAGWVINVIVAEWAIRGGGRRETARRGTRVAERRRAAPRTPDPRSRGVLSRGFATGSKVE